MAKKDSGSPQAARSVFQIPQSKQEWVDEGVDWLRTIVTVLIIFLPLVTFVVQGYRIPSGSMEDTLLVGDFLFADKITYGARIPLMEGKRMPGFRDPKPGDVVIFKSPETGETLIKRCVAIGGQRVEMRNEQLFVDGDALDEPYTKHVRVVPHDNFGPYLVPPGTIWCMGDNRDNSRDSRMFGPVALPLVIAKADILYFSWHWDWKAFFSGEWGKLQAPRIERIGKLLTSYSH
jgi:signal peptidase I